MSRYGTVGYDLGRVGRWARVGYGLLIAAGAAASTVIGLDEAADPGAFLLQAVVYLAAITAAYLLAYWLLGERLFARANPWLNTLILVGPALLIAYWNITLGYALGAELPAPLVLAMLAYVAASFLVQAAIGYGGCEVVALPILVFRRRYVSYCLPIVMIDAAERGWMESSGLRRGVWVALGFASLVTVTLGLTRVGPPLLSGLAFVIVAVLVATLTYLDRRAARLRDRVAGVPAHAYGRTASSDRRGSDFDWEPHFAQVRDEDVSLDVTAASDFLRSSQAGGVARVFTVGFCFGGRISFNQATSDLGLAGVIGFYGRIVEERPGDLSAPLNRVHAYRCPVLGFFGGADPKITPEHAAAFRRALDAAGIHNEIVVYHGAPHSFFDRTFTDHEAAANDAWTRMLRFMI